MNAAKQCPAVAVLSCSSDGLQKITAEYEENNGEEEEEEDDEMLNEGIGLI